MRITSLHVCGGFSPGIRNILAATIGMYNQRQIGIPTSFCFNDCFETEHTFIVTERVRAMIFLKNKSITQLR
ncbi:MAG: hypothetical protein K0R92_2674 [Lachnospiraceae bacterium]|nr:hypothetical protein [Lachnospiraceae bacterium]